VEEIVKRLLGLRQAFANAAASSSSSNHICKSICQLLSGFAEQNMSVLLPHIDSALVQEYMAFLADCTLQSPTDIAEVTLPFWRALQKQIMSNGSSSPRSATVMSMFERLLTVLVQRAAFPDGWEEQSEMDQDYFLEFRLSLEKTLHAVFDVLGEARYLTILQHALEVNYNRVMNTPALLASASDWVPLEAAFFCVSVVAPSIPTSSPMLSQFAQAAFSITTVASQSRSLDRINENLIVTLINMFGSY
jgi:hypothetical protein